MEQDDIEHNIFLYYSIGRYLLTVSLYDCFCMISQTKSLRNVMNDDSGMCHNEKYDKDCSEIER